MITGDKVETAINIGYSSSLIEEGYEQIYLDGKNIQEIEASIEQALF